MLFIHRFHLLGVLGFWGPTVVVLENTLGGTLTWSYNGIGDYIGTLSVANFTANKTTLNIGPLGIIGFSQFSNTSTTQIELITKNTSAAYTNGLLINTMIEIRVYN